MTPTIWLLIVGMGTGPSGTNFNIVTCRELSVKHQFVGGCRCGRGRLAGAGRLAPFWLPMWGVGQAGPPVRLGQDLLWREAALDKHGVCCGDSFTLAPQVSAP